MQKNEMSPHFKGVIPFFVGKVIMTNQLIFSISNVEAKTARVEAKTASVRSKIAIVGATKRILKKEI